MQPPLPWPRGGVSKSSCNNRFPQPGTAWEPLQEVGSQHAPGGAYYRVPPQPLRVHAATLQPPMMLHARGSTARAAPSLLAKHCRSWRVEASLAHTPPRLTSAQATVQPAATTSQRPTLEGS